MLKAKSQNRLLIMTGELFVSLGFNPQQMEELVEKQSKATTSYITVFILLNAAFFIHGLQQPLNESILYILTFN